jgi:hypothetical protein
LAAPPISAPRGPVGLVEALWDGYLVAGWAADPQDRTARPVVRLMRGLDVLAEGEAALAREDGQPGFILASPEALTPRDFLQGRVRLRVVLPGRHAAATLPIGRPMLEALQAMESGLPADAAAPAPEPPPQRPIAPVIPLPPRALPPPPAPPARPASQPLVIPFTPRLQAVMDRRPEPRPAAPIERLPVPPTVQTAEAAPPEAVPEAPPPLGAMLDLARHAAAAGLPVLHLLVPRRASMPGGVPAPGLAALEQAAAGLPPLAADWVPLRHAFARFANPAALWRQDGCRLSVEGGLAVLTTLLSVLRLRRPDSLVVLDRAHRLVSRADLAALPRREIAGEAGGPSFLGVASPETEPALPADLFADQPEPRQVGGGLPGLQAWRQPGAPLPWRVVVMAEPGLGGSEGPAQLGWWLRVLAAETVLSEALHLAPPAAVVAAQPDLLLTLAAEPEG